MLFTTFLLVTGIAAVAVIAAVLLLRWRSGPGERLRVPVAPLTVAAITAGLVALGFLVI